jgi:hypothetical protein
MLTPHNSISAEAVRAELAVVLTSHTFARARSLAHLLSYLCEKCLRGEANQIKEYTIAVEAYGRSADFHQKDHSIVRVEIKRLRERLRQFYETEGISHTVRITIPIGQYAPVFLQEPDATQSLAVTESEQTEILLPSQESSLVEGDSAAGRVVSSQRWLWVGIGLLLFAVAVAFAIGSRQTGEGAAPITVSKASIPPSSATTLAGDTDEIRILAGSRVTKFIDRAGRVWSGDRYFTGGKVVNTPLPFVDRTLDPEIYQTSRQGDFRYDIPLKPGAYELRLHFVEDFYSPRKHSGGGETSRLFAVKANDETLLIPYDIYSDAGGDGIANIRVFKDMRPAPDGFLHLSFTSWAQGKALLNALEILPAKPGIALPLRLTAHDKAIFTAEGKEWLPCGYSKGGRIVARFGTVSGTTEPEIFQTERFGHFSVAIPVAPGRYTVKLYFAERYFGTNILLNAKKGSGSRIFHVYCNGEALLKNFDIYKEAGGAERALVKRFSGLEPDAQGKLLLEFKPVVNYPLINAIEVLDETDQRQFASSK